MKIDVPNNRDYRDVPLIFGDSYCRFYRIISDASRVCRLLLCVLRWPYASFMQQYVRYRPDLPSYDVLPALGDPFPTGR